MSAPDTRGFFSSRWVPCPDFVRELPAGLPDGFRAAGVACGIKGSGRPDLALLVSDASETTSAVRFTDSGVLAAPVLVTRERCDLAHIRAIVANAGNANAATGGRGMDDAAKMQGAGAMVGGVSAEQVAVASTGVIGVELDVSKIISGLRDASQRLAQQGDEDLAGAILTTDAFAKRCSLELTLPSGTVRLSAQAKGAGMISPKFATMFCFVQTDAALLPETAHLLLGVCVKRSFDRISVDGQLSTNDIAVLQCSGASGVLVAPESQDELRFGEALDAVLRQLALMIVADGEGAKRVGRVVVRGGEQRDVEAAARSIANSPLVKAALHGGDPNWGRIAQALGGGLPGAGQLVFDIAIEGIEVCSGGTAIPFDADALNAAVSGTEVEYVVDLPGSGAETEVFFSDLSHEYVTINAEYTT